jgi:hypothetical protein
LSYLRVVDYLCFTMRKSNVGKPGRMPLQLMIE